MAGGKAKDYIQDKLRTALWLIRSIHQRQRTIYKVTESIVKFQREFFDKGIAHLKPLILRDVAEDIGMHESTISRVTTNKYVHTPQGIFELKYFFNSSITRIDGDEIASEAVKNQIKQIVGGEDSQEPLLATRRSSSCCAPRASTSPGARSPSTASCWASCRRASARATTRRNSRAARPEEPFGRESRVAADAGPYRSATRAPRRDERRPRTRPT